MKKKVVVKIGGALNTKNGVANKPFIESICRQISGLMPRFGFVFVISGAIPIGISNSKDWIVSKSAEDQALYSMIGQTDLVNEYIEILRKYGIKSGQGLYTTNTLQNEFTKKVFEKALEKDIVILANENDAVNPEELDGDNDPLASKIAKIIKADYLIILTSIDDGIECDISCRSKINGIIDNGVIRKIRKDSITREFLEEIDKGTTSRKDSNGIQVKLKAGRDACNGGVKEVFVVNGRREGVLIGILLKNELLGTLIVD